VTEIVVGDARVVLGDCRDVLRTLADNSVDSVVTDPPYEIGFMGRSWDSTGIAYDVTVWAECLRVLKPGGHILAFGGSRTWHRLAVAVEDAGFEIRDSIAWIYGSGFPKSLDVSKAIDKKAGAEREVIGQGKSGKTAIWNEAGKMGNFDLTAPTTSEAKQWSGWGTALKPAFEPIVVGRKPFGKGVTVAENVLVWGVGGLNIDASRVKYESGEVDFSKQQKQGVNNPLRIGGAKPGDVVQMWKPEGRWPANVILDEVTAGLVDEQSGVSASNNSPRNNNEFQSVAKGKENAHTTFGHTDSGGASRFFYQAKASKRDRNEGLEGLENSQVGSFDGNTAQTAGRKIGANPDQPNLPGKNHHPTVKPTQLMRYLIKLVTPPGGTVLDPFTGSGSTGKAALLDGYKFVGAELTEEYLPIIEGRLRWALEQDTDVDKTLF
jgi:DNA modification methylase